MKMKRRQAITRFICSSLAVVATLASTATATISAPAASVPTSLRGTYVATLPNTQHVVPAGQWRLVLRASSYRLHNPVSPRAIIPGPVIVSGNRIVFVDRSIDRGCGTAVRGTYRFLLRGKTLLFTKIKDGCKGRVVVLARSWKKLS